MTNVEIRSLQPEDKAQWLELWKGYQEYYETNLDEITPHLWENLLQEAPDGPLAYVAVDGEQLLGLVHFLFHGSTWSTKQRIYLHDLFTVPEARGKGVGRKLIEAVYDEGESRGCDSVYWLTQDFNEDARKLYDKVANLTPFIKYSKAFEALSHRPSL